MPTAKESKEFKRNKIALTRAVETTKKELKSVAKTKTITTYPAGKWKSTLKKNFDKTVKLLGGKSNATTVKTKAKKASAPKTSDPKKKSSVGILTRKTASKRTLANRAKQKRVS